jgi:hypothetical protein
MHGIMHIEYMQYPSPHAYILSITPHQKKTTNHQQQPRTMADLILNFETEPPPSQPKNRHIQTTPGSWTHKHKQKRRAKHLDKLQTNNAQPKTTTTSDQHPQSQPQNYLKRNQHEDQDTEAIPESRKKPK